jgi:hypothetical protein
MHCRAAPEASTTSTALIHPSYLNAPAVALTPITAGEHMRNCSSVKRYVFTGSQTDTCVYDESGKCSTSQVTETAMDPTGRRNSHTPCFKKPPRLLPNVGLVTINLASNSVTQGGAVRHRRAGPVPCCSSCGPACPPACGAVQMQQQVAVQGPQVAAAEPRSLRP